MHSEKSIIFLFAHQDDEFGVMFQIEKEIKSGASVFCIFATSGVAEGVNPKQRNDESLRVLKALGVDSRQILFIGETLNISDCNLGARSQDFSQWLMNWLQGCKQVTSVYIPAWEGGHQDHDALHSITMATILNFSSEANVWQYPLYNSSGLNWGLFRVLTPLPENGEVFYENIMWTDRLRYLRLCLSYKSQVKSWLGLFPFVVWHYLFKGWQSLQLASLSRILERPHAGKLYSEFRDRS